MNPLVKAYHDWPSSETCPAGDPSRAPKSGLLQGDARIHNRGKIAQGDACLTATPEKLPPRRPHAAAATIHDPKEAAPKRLRHESHIVDSGNGRMPGT